MAASLKVFPCGAEGMLFEFTSELEKAKAYLDWSAGPPAGVRDIVPAARTILVTFDARHTDSQTLRKALLGRARTPQVPNDTTHAIVEVTYNGPDLDFVSARLGMDAPDFVKWHSRQRWRVAFSGFMPGFAYMTSPAHRRSIPRLDSPRQKVSAGSVAMAGLFTGIYPQSSPGGWRLIGTTNDKLWDVTNEPPATLRPGVTVQLVAVE